MLVLLKDNNDEWQDFSDRYIKMSTVSHKSGDTITTSTFSTSVSNLIMDNSDNYWDDPSNWQTNWTLSKNNSEVFLKGTEVLLREKFVDKDNINLYSLGRFKVDRFYTKQSKAILKLNSRSQWLNKKNKKADKVKDGRAWYRYRSISFLLRELLKLKFNVDDISGTVSSVDNNTLTVDKFLPQWIQGVRIKNVTRDQWYNIYKRVSSNSIEVKVIDGNDSLNWSSNDSYLIDGSNSLPDSFNIPERLLIPTYGGIRVFSEMGKTPTNVKHNLYSGG